MRTLGYLVMGVTPPQNTVVDMVVWDVYFNINRDKTMSSQQETTKTGMAFFSMRALLVSIILALVTPLLIAPAVGESDIGTHYVIYFAFVFVAVYIGALLSQETRQYVSDDDDSEESDEADDREEGTVKWFNSSKGFGFLTMDNGDDVFVHYRAIRGRGRRFLIEGQKVRFYVTEGEKGKQAESVSIVKK